MNSKSMQLLLIEDNPGDAFIIQDMLKQLHWLQIQCTHVERLGDAIQHLSSRPADAVLLDLSLPDSYGLDTLLSLQDQLPTLPIVILTGMNDEELAVHAVQEGAQDYLVKGQVSQDTLVKAVRYAIERKKIELELKQRTLELEIANQTLKQRTAQLELANQELEAFSYTVSHDLANPLSVILGFTGLLELQYAKQLDGQGQRYITLIEQSAKRMGQLIQDLLQLSKMASREVQIESVDLSRLVQDTWLEIQQRQPDRVVDTIIHPGLVVQADANLLSIALDNLLGNAWKYTSKREHARIEIGAVSSESLEFMSTKPLRPNQGVYFVRDNGAGFDMQKASQLFKPFQRLHAKQDFEGTGIGLATVQRIIQRHGGEIWTEAAVDQGATFYFSLPSVPIDHPSAN
ncbi:MAG: ATP-binding protein [Cyanobacteria bacterium P01_D01_bin.44]